MKLEGFLFFGSTIQVLNKFKGLVDENKTTPFPQRVRYVILDFTNVKNIDHSSCETFKVSGCERRGLPGQVVPGLGKRAHTHFA